MTFNYTCPNCETELEYDFTPSRPAPACSNHDSPAFSDPGDGAECEGPEECTNCHESIDMDKVIEQAEEKCATNGEATDRNDED